jgi:hypothetical protein
MLVSMAKFRMHAGETKQSGGKILPHSGLWGWGVFLEEATRNTKRKRDLEY